MKSAPCARDMMIRTPLKLRKGTLLRTAAEKMAKKRVPSAPVVDDNGDLIGFFSVQRLLDAVAEIVHHQLAGGFVESYLAPDPPTVAEDAGCMSIVDVFRGVGNEHTTLAVLRGDKLVGTITRYDLIWALYNYFKHANEQTRIMYLSALRDQEEAPF